MVRAWVDALADAFQTGSLADALERAEPPGPYVPRTLRPLCGLCAPGTGAAAGDRGGPGRGDPHGELAHGGDDLAALLLAEAQILDGEIPADPAAFARRLNELIVRGLKA